MATPEGQLAARQFVAAVNCLNAPPTGELERQIHQRTGMRVKVFPAGDMQPLPDELREHILEGVNTALRQADITDAFRGHIVGAVNEQTQIGMLRTLGPKEILEQCGFDAPML